MTGIISTAIASSLFLQHNDALVPPYRVLIDTNFINFSLQNKIELVAGMMDCLFAKCKFSIHCHFTSELTAFDSGIPCVTDCVLAELEKLGHRYRVALRCANSCSHRDASPDILAGWHETLALNGSIAAIQGHMPMTALSSASRRTAASLLQHVTGSFEGAFARSLACP